MTTKLRPLAGLTLSAAILASALVCAPAANAAEVSLGDTGTPVATSDEVSLRTIEQAIAEARSAGAIRAERVDADGTRVVVIDGGDGFTMELSDLPDAHRLSAGSDSYGGVFVGFNSFDQNLIIGGAGAGLTAGICLLGPAVCAVATVAIVIGSAAVSSSGGVQCGSKSLRVYPISNKKPRCA